MAEADSDDGELTVSTFAPFGRTSVDEREASSANAQDGRLCGAAPQRRPDKAWHESEAARAAARPYPAEGLHAWAASVSSRAQLPYRLSALCSPATARRPANTVARSVCGGTSLRG